MEDDLNFRVVACEFLEGNDWETRVWFRSTQLVVVDQGCARPTFHFETETETFGCWYQESRLRLRLFTMVSKIETETETFHFGLKS